MTPGRATATRIAVLCCLALALQGSKCNDRDGGVRQRIGGSERPRDPGIKKNLRILGVQKHVTFTGDLASASSLFEEKVAFGVPNGTQRLLVVPNHWRLGFGPVGNAAKLLACLGGGDVPYDGAPFSAPLPAECFQGAGGFERHPLGMGLVDVFVSKLDPPVAPPTPQNGEVTVQMRLADKTGDDPWFGYVVYDVVYLGEAPPVFVGPQGPKGKTGSTGAQGARGGPGPAGPNGVAGASGTAGAPGPGVTMIGGGSGAPVAGSATLFEPLFHANVSPTEAVVEQTIGVAGTLSNFSVRLSSAPIIPNSMRFEVRRNGVDSGVFCSVVGNLTSCRNTTATVAFSTTDRISIKSSGTSTMSPKMNWTAKYTLQ